ncbi:MAG: DUF2628 domain-containing protein [Fimbriimonadaceae bacterium]|nr:DUF2628 domain-containing protein [Alphaproteobacteria bacterium]
MTIYSAHTPPAQGGLTRNQSEGVRFVADKFSWPALFFNIVWLIWHRMWWALAGFIIIVAVVPPLAILLGIHDTAFSWIALAALLLFANEAVSLRRWSLARRGYRLAAIISARDEEDCARKFFAAWSPAMPAKEGKTSPPVSGSGQKPLRLKPAEPDVIGMFPGPGAQK